MLTSEQRRLVATGLAAFRLKVAQEEQAFINLLAFQLGAHPASVRYRWEHLKVAQARKALRQKGQ